jgi:PPOX class probable F420-dependent enzyme
MTLSRAARELIQSDAHAHLVTLDGQGRPNIALVWVGLDGDEIVCGHLDPNQQKLRNIRRNPQVSLSIESPDLNVMGLREYLVIHGKARLTEGGAAELLQRLARTYLGPDVRFPPFDNPPPGVITHIEIERVGGAGAWTQ